VQKCKPSAEHIESHAQVVKEVKRRDDHEKIQSREMAQRSLESGQPDDASTWKSLLALKVVLLSWSASACKHSWSIEGWIHSNRRNRIGQKLVERLVRTHTNLKLEQRLEMYETGLLPWDIEMTVEESVSDEDDGPPHRVSDSDSESESE
jgi:hypothetical protein